MTQEALKLALEALTYIYTETTADEDELIDQAITALEEAMAQPEQEPVAWMDEDGDVLSASTVDGKGLRNIPLYAYPPQRTWVGLTDEEMQAVVDAQPLVSSINVYFKAIEAKLKEKNT